MEMGNIMSSSVYQRQGSATKCSTNNKVKFINSTVGASFLLLASQLIMPTQVNAAEVVGKAIHIKNRVTASKGNRKLSKSDNVFASEKIKASRNSDGQLLLKDNSKVIIGENSTVKLDNFVVSKGGISKGTFKVTKGALRLISGNGKKGKYKIKTPVATIGVRGTAVDVFVRRGGATDVILYNGAIDACTSQGCETLSRVCDVINIKPSGSISKVSSFRYRPDQKEDENSRFNEMWPQGGFAKTHQVREWVCKANAVHELNLKKNEYNRVNEEDKDEPEPPVTPPPVTPPVVKPPLDTTGPTSDPYDGTD